MLMLFRKILILGVILFLVFLTAGAGITKEVSQYSARTVAQNWLHHLTESHRFGNSEFISAEVKIIGEEVMVYKNRVVGYNFILSPRGHIVVPFRDELPPVKLYSDTTTLRMADNSDVAEWIREELFKVYEELDSKKQEFASIDFSDTPNGRLWALFDVDSSSFPSEYMAATSGTEFLSIGPLLTTTWAQGDPYNQLLPSVECCTVCRRTDRDRVCGHGCRSDYEVLELSCFRTGLHVLYMEQRIDQSDVKQGFQSEHVSVGFNEKQSQCRRYSCRERCCGTVNV